MWSGFQVYKLNTRREFELQLIENWNQPENQADLIPGPDHDKKIEFQILFQKSIACSAGKGQPAASTYVREKGVVTCYTNRETPYIMNLSCPGTPSATYK